MGDAFDFQVLNLTDAFYRDYPPNEYRELLTKAARPYNCLLIQSHYGYFICIPYRSQITHKNAFFFRKSRRSRESKSGLDYTKIVIVENTAYLSSENAVVDADEYAETRLHIDTIKRDAMAYVDEYVRAARQGELSREQVRKYEYSTLRYFRKELGIAEIKAYK